MRRAAKRQKADVAFDARASAVLKVYLRPSSIVKVENILLLYVLC